MTELEAMGVKPIEAVGQEFNPDLHNAVMHVEDEEVGENIVVEEFQKGYMYRESVVRYSMVKVANESMKDTDVIIFVVDATQKIGNEAYYCDIISEKLSLH